MRLYQMADAVRYGLMNTEELRETFLLEGMFEPGEIEILVGPCADRSQLLVASIHLSAAQ